MNWRYASSYPRSTSSATVCLRSDRSSYTPLKSSGVSGLCAQVDCPLPGSALAGDSPTRAASSPQFAEYYTVIDAIGLLFRYTEFMVTARDAIGLTTSASLLITCTTRLYQHLRRRRITGSRQDRADER